MIDKITLRGAFAGLLVLIVIFISAETEGHGSIVSRLPSYKDSAKSTSNNDCWNYQPDEMKPNPGWDAVDLNGLTREELLDVLGCPPHIIRMTSVVSPEKNRELWVYHPFDDEPTGLFVWLKGNVFHKWRLDEFNGFWCYEMSDVTFWD